MGRSDLHKITNGYDTKAYFDEYQRILKKFNAFIFCSNKQLGDLIKEAENRGLTATTLIWWKYNAAPLHKNKWKNDIEYVVHIKEPGVAFTGAAKVDKIPMVRSKTGHPTEKPIELIEKYIKIGSKEGDVVLDPFSGSGTTALACKRIKRKYIVYEIEKKWFDKSVERVSAGLVDFEEW